MGYNISGVLLDVYPGNPGPDRGLAAVCDVGQQISHDVWLKVVGAPTSSPAVIVFRRCVPGQMNRQHSVVIYQVILNSVSCGYMRFGINFFYRIPNVRVGLIVDDDIVFDGVVLGVLSGLSLQQDSRPMIPAPGAIDQGISRDGEPTSPYEPDTVFEAPG